MRILHVSDFYLPRLGGIEMHVSDLALRQRAAGHEVTVVTSSPSAAPAAPDRVPVVRLTDGFRHPRAIHPLALAAGVRELSREAPDVVHVHAGVASPLGFWLARSAARSGLPTVVTVHSLWAWAHPIFRSLALASGYHREPICWTAVSEAAARSVRRVVRDGATVSVLPNGIDPEDWAVERLPRTDDEVLLVAVMRLAQRKRPLPLARMLRAVRRQVPPGIRLRVVLAGDGPQRPALDRYLARHGMRAWVELPGRQTRRQIRELYRRADAFIAPADLESFGIAALEARCAGVPVVAKLGTGIGEFVRHDREGLLVPDDAAMVAALVELSVRPDLRARLAAAGPSPVTWSATLRLTEQAYREAGRLQRERGRPPCGGTSPVIWGG